MSNRWIVSILTLGMMPSAFALCAGCSRDARLADEKLRSPDVKVVSHYGLTLDESASPQDVAFAALQAIRADWEAKTKEDREAALDVQFQLAAANEIINRNRLALSPEEFLFTVVNHWTPTVAYYVDDFPKTLEDAKRRLVARSVAEDEAELAMVVNAPGNPPEAQVVMLIWLAKDKGLWRILHFGFDARTRTLGRARPKEVTEPQPGMDE